MLTLQNTLLYISPAIIGAVAVRYFVANKFMFITYRLPATFLHELTHLIVGLLTNAKPASASIIPHKQDDGSWKLGSVTFSNIRWYNGALIGLSPVLLGLVFVPLIPSQWTFSHTQIKDVWIWLAMAYVLPSAIPSNVDFLIALKSSIPLFILAAIGALLYFY